MSNEKEPSAQGSISAGTEVARPPTTNRIQLTEEQLQKIQQRGKWAPYIAELEREIDNLVEGKIPPIAWQPPTVEEAKNLQGTVRDWLRNHNLLPILQARRSERIVAVRNRQK